MAYLFRSITVALTLLAGLSGTASAQTNLPEFSVEFILDASGSMLAKEKGEIKIATAKKMMNLVIETFEKENAITGLRVFGHLKPKSCDKKLIEQKLGFYPKNFELTKKMIASITPAERGMTPIAQALKDSAKALENMPGKKRIVLITDGTETCGGDPCAVAAELKKKLDLTIYVLTYNAKKLANFRELECLGPTKNADSPEGFADAISEFKFDILDTKQTIIVKGPNPEAWAVATSQTNPAKSFRFISSLGANLPPDEYNVQVLYAPPFEFKNVVLETNERKVLITTGNGFIRFPVKNLPVQLSAQDLLSNKKYTFYAGEKIEVPVSRYNVWATTTTGLAHQWDNLTVTPLKTIELSLPNWGTLSVIAKEKVPFDVVDINNDTPSLPAQPAGQTEIRSIEKLKLSAGFFLSGSTYVLPDGTYNILIGDRTYSDLKIKKSQQTWVDHNQHSIKTTPMVEIR